MGRWTKGNSGNPRGRPKRGTAIAEIARDQIERHQLVEKLGSIGAGEGDYREADVDQQLRAIQLLLAYGYGPPKADKERNEGGVIIQVVYAETNQIAIAGATPGAVASHSGSETVQRGLLRATLGEDGPGDGPADPSGSGR